METYEFSYSFELGGLLVAPVHMRVEQLRPIIPMHQHSNISYEIHYTRQGRGEVTIGALTHRVEPDTLYITGPGVAHAQRSDHRDPVVEYCLYLNCETLSRTTADPFSLFVRTNFWMGKDGGRVYPLLEALVEECRRPGPGTREMTRALLMQIIIQLARVYGQDVSPRSIDAMAPALTRAGFMPIIEDAFFYRYQTLTLKDLAGLLNLSVRQTQRLLMSNFGKTFSQKLTEARMAAAAQLLSDTDLTVTEISDRLGYSSIEHFSSAFKRSMDCSPRQYRKNREQGTGK